MYSFAAEATFCSCDRIPEEMTYGRTKDSFGCQLQKNCLAASLLWVYGKTDSIGGSMGQRRFLMERSLGTKFISEDTFLALASSY